MATKLTPKLTALRSTEFLAAWRQFAPELTLAGRTLAEFEEERLIPAEVQQRLNAAKAQYTGCIGERNQALNDLKDVLIMLANAVRGDVNHGPDSSFYRALGFVTKRERKRPGPKPKPKRTAATPPDQPAE